MKNKTLFQFIISTLSCAILITVIISTAGSDSIDSFAQDKAAEGDFQSKNIETISTDKGYDLYQNNINDPKFLVLDVRTPAEYKEGHIENAVNIDFLSPTFRDDLGKLDKTNTYIIHCRSGGRSSQALDVMDDMGFQNVYNIGGIIDWGKRGYPVVK